MSEQPANVLQFPNGRAPETNGVAIHSEGNVIIPHIVTRLDFPADRTLHGAIGKLSGAVVMGYNEDGTIHFASSIADGAEILWLLEKCKQHLLEVCE